MHGKKYKSTQIDIQRKNSDVVTHLKFWGGKKRVQIEDYFDFIKCTIQFFLLMFHERRRFF